jgi:DNA-binding transcriptional LysR family regulator
MLRTGEIDIALDITANFRPAARTASSASRSSTIPMYVALPANHPARAKRTLTLSELGDENWILGTTGSCPDASIFLRSCQIAGFEPRISFNSDDYFAMQGFVAAGVGASFIPDLALDQRPRRHRRALARRRPPAPAISAAVLDGSYRSPAKQAMLDVLLEVGAEFAGGRRELSLAS